jgi:hypothetical protein
MRKTSKSSLYKAFTSLQLDIPFESCVYVIDGGYLLHRVVWQTGQTFGSICDSYVDFVKSKYTEKAVVIFDGYPGNMAEVFTKFVERKRRSRKMISNEVVFNDTMVPTVPKEKFLAKDRNKNCLLQSL